MYHNFMHLKNSSKLHTANLAGLLNIKQWLVIVRRLSS